MKESELCFPSTLQARGSLRLLLALCALLLAGLAHAQSVLDKTDYGKSQNTNQDIANSLIPGPKRVGKGEKREEVDPKKLPSKSIKDPTFEGSLNDIGLDWTGDKMGKPRTSNDADSKAPKKVDAASEKDPKVSKQSNASGDKEKVLKPKDVNGDGQNKDQKTAPAVTGEKRSEKEKASASKPDGDR